MIFKLTYPTIAYNGSQYNTTTVHPRFKGCKFKHTRPDNAFFFRVTLEGDLIFYNSQRDGFNDFNIFYNYAIGLESLQANPLTKFTLNVYKDCDLVNAYFTGQFTIMDCKIDMDARTCAVKVSPLDDYTDLYKVWDVEKNLVNIKAETGDNGHSYAGELDCLVESQHFYETCVVERYEFITVNLEDTDGRGRPINIAGQTVWGQDSSDPKQNDGWEVYTQVVDATNQPNFKVTTTYIREYFLVVSVNGQSTPPVSNGNFQYVYVGPYYPYYNDIKTDKYVKHIDWPKDANGLEDPNLAHWTKTYNPLLPLYTFQYAGDYLWSEQNLLSRCRSLVDVINYLVEDANLVFESRFFFDSINPVALYTGDNTNYNPNQCGHTLFAFYDDVVNQAPEYKATKVMVKLSDLLSDLCTMFDLRWWVDGTKFRMEHWAYYNNFSYQNYAAAQTTQNYYYEDLTDPDTAKLTEAIRSIEFIPQNVIDVEKFSFPTAMYADMVGVPISWVDYTNRNEVIKDNQVKTMTADLQYAVLYGSGQDTNQLVIISTTYITSGMHAGKYVPNSQLGIVTRTSFPNAPFGWPALHRDFLQWSRLFMPKINNVKTLTGLSGMWKLTKPVVFPVCCGETFDPMRKLRVHSGNGNYILQVNEASEDLTTGLVTCDCTVSSLTLI